MEWLRRGCCSFAQQVSDLLRLMPPGRWRSGWLSDFGGYVGIERWSAPDMAHEAESFIQQRNDYSSTQCCDEIGCGRWRSLAVSRVSRLNPPDENHSGMNLWRTPKRGDWADGWKAHWPDRKGKGVFGCTYRSPITAGWFSPGHHTWDVLVRVW
jgi:hypothetical protein